MSLIIDLVEQVRILAKEKPDNVYNRPVPHQYCHYNSGICSDGSIGCIMGQAFERLGYNKNEIQQIGGSIENILSQKESYDSSIGAFWLKKVQSLQDMGIAWSKAVATSDMIFPIS